MELALARPVAHRCLLFHQGVRYLQNVLTTYELTKDYATRAVDTVSLEFKPGEIHALLGANGAGKSTLCKMIAGLVRPTSGSMILAGRNYSPRDKKEAERFGVQIVQQELNLVPSLNVAENLFLSNLPHRWGVLRTRRLLENARQLLRDFGLHSIDPCAHVSELGIGERQMVEIAANLSRDCRILILDEPTAALSLSETELLMQHLHDAKRKGVAILYISHRLDEVERIANRISILRDAKLVGTWPQNTLNQSEMVSFMTYGMDRPEGSSNGVPTPPQPTEVERLDSHPPQKADPLLILHRVSRRPRVQDISFEVATGEILGIAGLVGSGRTELLRLIFGADRADQGEMEIRYSPAASVQTPRDGLLPLPQTPSQAVERGIVMISEDRKSDGLWLPQSIASNIAWSKFRGNFVELLRPFSSRPANSTAETFRRSLAIRCDNTQHVCEALSGGNQQKVVLAKWLHRDGTVFLFDEPTRGIDPAAREIIYQVMRDLCQRGKGLVVVSSDLEELLKISHRIGVISNGRWMKDFQGPDFRREEIVAAMFEGYQNQGKTNVKENEVLQ